MNDLDTTPLVAPMQALIPTMGRVQFICNTRATHSRLPCVRDVCTLGRWSRWIYYRAAIPQICERAVKPCESIV
jgi:hypothetical protein